MGQRILSFFGFIGLYLLRRIAIRLAFMLAAAYAVNLMLSNPVVLSELGRGLSVVMGMGSEPQTEQGIPSVPSVGSSPLPATGPVFERVKSDQSRPQIKVNRPSTAERSGSGGFFQKARSPDTNAQDITNEAAAKAASAMQEQQRKLSQ